MRSPRLATCAAAACLAASVLAGCSSSPEPSPSTSDTAVGGQAVCDEATIEKVVSDDVAATYPGAAFVSLDDFDCEGGWAKAQAQVETSGTTVPTVFFLRAEGQFWIPTSIEDICSEAQADSSVPESIYVDACGVQ